MDFRNNPKIYKTMIKCPNCKTYNAILFTEDYRKKIICKFCGLEDYLKSNNYAHKTNIKKLDT